MLSKFPNRTLKVGAKVSLSPQHSYSRGYSNPLGVVGIVDRIHRTIDTLGVQWENGMHNTYRKSDYDLIAEGEPGYLETI